MKIDMKFEGGRDIERALANLPRAASKTAARRALKTALEPVRLRAEQYTNRFRIITRATIDAGEKRRARSDFAGNVVSMFVGPVREEGSSAPEALFFEFGTGPRFHEDGHPTGEILPDPFMRPAWDAALPHLLPRLGAEMWSEISKATARLAAKAAAG